MLQELGFHKCAKFLPFPEYWAGKLHIDKLERIANKSLELANKHSRRAAGMDHYVRLGGAHAKKVMQKELPKTNARIDRLDEIRRTMDDARFMRLGIK